MGVARCLYGYHWFETGAIFITQALWNIWDRPMKRAEGGTRELAAGPSTRIASTDVVYVVSGIDATSRKLDGSPIPQAKW